MTQDEIREKKLREAQETRNRLRSANQEQQVAVRKYRNQKPSPTVIRATIDRDLDPSKRLPTGGWVMRISDCPHPIEGGIGREFHNVECSSGISCNTTGATIPTGTASASFVLWHHGSGSTTSDRSNVSRMTAEGQGEQGSSDLARHDAEDLNNTGVLQSVRVD